LKITVLGATGKTGLEIVRQGLAAGHEISVLARDPQRLGEYLTKVRVVKGDSLDSDAIQNAILGSEAVLSALGQVRGSPPDLLSRSATSIVGAMKKQKINRLIVLANMGSRDPNDRPGLYNRLLLSLLTIFRGSMARDTANETRIISESGLNWTIARASLLTDGPLTKTYKVGSFDRSAGTRVSRGSVADFMISCAVNGNYIRAKPVISE